jgi:hypothetical protein
MFASGVRFLLSLCIDLLARTSAAQAGGALFIQQQLSLGLALTLIGGPLWFFFWRDVVRHTTGNEAEIGAALRKAFLNVVAGVAAIFGLFAAKDLLKWLMFGAPFAQFDAGWIANLVVTALVWYYHWHLSEAEGQPSPAARTWRRWYVYVLSGFGLVWLTAGAGQLLHTGLLYLPLWGQPLVFGSFWNALVHNHIAWVLLGGPLWWFHWFRMGAGDFDSNLRQVYLYLITTFGGIISVLVAVSVSLYNIFFAVFGGGSGLPNYWEFVTWTIPTGLIAGAVWGFHTRVAQEEAARAGAHIVGGSFFARKQVVIPQAGPAESSGGEVRAGRSLLVASARRILLYLMSFVGLGTLISGVITLVGLLVNLWIIAAGSPVLLAPDWWRGQLALSLALVIVGAPIWLYYWKQVIDLSAAGQQVEWAARSRRVYLYVLVGASIVALAADLVNVIFQVLTAALSRGIDVRVLLESRWSIQTLFVAAPVLWYHWGIVRQDQRRGAETAAVKKAVTLIIADAFVEIVPGLEEKLGYRVKVSRYLGPVTGAPPPPESDLDALAAEIGAASGPKVVVVMSGGKPQVIPYQER